MFRRASMAFGCIAMASCANVVRVHTDNMKDGGTERERYKKVAGIPFYGKSEQFRQSTIYTKTWVKATLSVDKRVLGGKDGKELTLSKQIFERQIAKGGVGSLDSTKRAIFNADNQDGDAALDVITKFMALPALDNEASVAPELRGNSVVSEWVVDQSKAYYLNAPLPWFGSGSLTQKLNSDGTLAEATATQDTKVAEGLSALIPFKEYLTGRFVKDLSSQSAEDAVEEITPQGLEFIGQGRPWLQLSRKEQEAAKVVYVLALSVEEIGNEYTFVSVHKCEPESPTPIGFDTTTAMFSVKPVAAAKEEKKDETPEIGISGSISLPKEWVSPEKSK